MFLAYHELAVGMRKVVLQFRGSVVSVGTLGIALHCQSVGLPLTYVIDLVRTQQDVRAHL